MELKFSITNDYIKVCELKIAPVADSINHLHALFDFDDAWDDSIKTAVFGGIGKTYHVILQSDNRCVIPWEVLTGTYFTVSVFGINDLERITSTEIKIPLAPSGYKSGQSPSEPSDSAYTQLLGMIAFIITGKDSLNKFIQGSTEVAEIINIDETSSGKITLKDALENCVTKNKYYYTADNTQNYQFQEMVNLMPKAEDSIGKSEIIPNSGGMLGIEVLQDVSNKENKTEILNKTGDTLNVTMDDNTETRCSVVNTLTLTLPESTNPDYISSINFTSSYPATNIIYPDTISMMGMDCMSNVFVPENNKRYNIILYYDGDSFVGVVGGYDR